MARALLLHPVGIIHPRGSGLIVARAATTAPPPDAVVWDKAASEPNYQYDYPQLTATRPSGPSGDKIVRCTLARTSGYCEIAVTLVLGSYVIGLATASQSITDWVGNSSASIGYLSDGRVFFNSALSATYATYTTGDVIGICFKGGKFYASKNGVWQGGSDPSAGTGGIDVSATITNAHPAGSSNSTANTWAANFGASPLAYAIPTGVTSWDGSQPITTSVNPFAGHLAFTGYQPAITLTTAVSPSAGHLIFGGKIPSVSVNFAVSPSTGHLVFTGYAPAVVPGVNVNPLTGHLTFAGHVPSLAFTTAVSPASGHLTFGGKVPSVALNVNAFPSAGHLTFAGYAPSLSFGLTPAAGHLVFAGYVPDVSGTAVAPDALPLKVHFRHRNRNG